MRALVDLRPLRANAVFRRLWIGGNLSGLGGQLTTVAVLYQAWQLTGSPVGVGAVGLAKAIPMVVFGLVGGALADAVDRRRLVLLTTLGQVVVAALLAAQALAGLGSWWVLLGLVALQATFAALGAPAGRTFAVRLLPADQVQAGIALTHLSFQLSMLVGPALGGVIVGQWGVSACYVIDALTFGAAMYGVFGLPALRPLSDEGTPARPSLGLRAMWEGWRFIWTRPVLTGALLTDVLATVLAMPVSMFPAINAERFGDRPETLGLFLSAIAVGGVAAGTASGAVTRTGRPGIVMLCAAGVWGAGLAGFGLASPLWLALACLAVAGAADTLTVISRGAILQLETPDSHRGRVSAAEHVIGVSGPDLGNFRGGLVAGVTSAPFSVVSGGLLCLAGIVLLALLNRPLRRFRAADPQPSPADQPTSAQ